MKKNIIDKLNDKDNKISKIDFLIISIMILLYSIISFYHLGDIKAPKTYYYFNNIGESIVIELKDNSSISKMRYYTGNITGNFTIQSSIDGENYQELANIITNSVFSWEETKLNDEITAKFIKITSNEANISLGDLVFYDNEENKISINTAKFNPLTDELNLVPDRISYLNSMYFDEIYYARSAYEYVHGIDCFEWTHPPLGKLIMTIPILIFGFSPFTYRFMGNLAGILLIPIMYILAKKIFKNRKWAFLAGLLMMFDNFHFVHTRIALVDGFQVLFILLSVLFMKNYIDLKKKDSFKKKAINLILSGLFIGCAITTKWNAMYVGLALAIIFFIHLLNEYNISVFKLISFNKLLKYLNYILFIPLSIYYLTLLIFSKDVSKIVMIIYLGILLLIILIKFIKLLLHDKYLLKLFIICIISFILIPIIIYILSYILFPNVSYYDKTLLGIIDQTKIMYDYHSNLVANHPFTSNWYQWPIMYKPVWFYTSPIINFKRMTISDIGNPSIWWFGIISFIYLVVNCIKKKESSNIFILIFILSSFIPYIFIGRIMFMYHYFITLPFIMLAIVSFVKWITEKIKNDKFYFIYIGIVIIMFIIFYPIVSGTLISEDYINSLSWLSSWYF